MASTRRELFAVPLACLAPDSLTERVRELSQLVSALSLKLTEADERVSELSKTSPPIGTVIMWWGDRTNIPPGWEECDGQAVRTPGARLTGVKPNLVDRFPKGAGAKRKTTAELAQAVGGRNNMPALKIAKVDKLVTNSAGSHTHPVSVRENGGDNKRKGCEVTTHDSFWNTDPRDGKGMQAAGDHAHTLTGHVGKDDGVDADGGDQTGANQPAYQEVFFLIRTK